MAFMKYILAVAIMALLFVSCGDKSVPEVGGPVAVTLVNNTSDTIYYGEDERNYYVERSFFDSYKFVDEEYMLATCNRIADGESVVIEKPYLHEYWYLWMIRKSDLDRYGWIEVRNRNLPDLLLYTKKEIKELGCIIVYDGEPHLPVGVGASD